MPKKNPKNKGSFAFIKRINDQCKVNVSEVQNKMEPHYGIARETLKTMRAWKSHPTAIDDAMKSNLSLTGLTEKLEDSTHELLKTYL